MGMNIDPKRIERLWEACPELRPFGMIYSRDTGYFDVPRNHHAGAGYLATVDPDFVGPLICINIIRWVATQNERLDILAPRGDRKEWEAYANGHASAEDFTEFCVQLAERVLRLPEWTGKNAAWDAHVPRKATRGKFAWEKDV